MNAARRIKKVFRSKQTIEGAGVHLKRAFGFSEVGQFDPFLLLDDFRSSDPRYYLAGFPWHPHRGIETITYILQGKVEHGDSLGNRGVIDSGDVQWMTAGSGIIHQEMPKGPVFMNSLAGPWLISFVDRPRTKDGVRSSHVISKPAVVRVSASSPV